MLAQDARRFHTFTEQMVGKIGGRDAWGPHGKGEPSRDCCSGCRRGWRLRGFLEGHGDGRAAPGEWGKSAGVDPAWANGGVVPTEGALLDGAIPVVVAAD